ncbi:unnamed protein product [Notodromas monacha]|uniref:Elongator complex protein 6 n=1 Tax=Notodromas monacha TaxID=399045 RepID=A0A7R9BQF4_9CRUS|nr:unnamed protein product [Notodromas monacha]CAG0919738.1 unnamed protein product [Notodromas monacha]
MYVLWRDLEELPDDSIDGGTPKMKSRFLLHDDTLGMKITTGSVTLAKGEDNLIGISIGGGAPYCPCLYVVQIFDNSPASRDGTLEAGDEIIGVGNHCVKGKTKGEVAKLIQGQKDQVMIKYNKLHADPKQGKSLDIVLKKAKHKMVENMSTSAADALGLSRAILCNDSLIKKLDHLSKMEDFYRGLTALCQKLMKAMCNFARAQRSFGEAFSSIGVREPQPRASEVFTTFGEYHRLTEKTAYSFLQRAGPVWDQLDTYLRKAIPDTKMTIRKYADAKFEYLSYCLKVKEMDDEEYTFASLNEPLYRVETGNYEYRLILRCRQEARKAFAALRGDVVVKIDLLDQKHEQHITTQYTDEKDDDEALIDCEKDAASASKTDDLISVSLCPEIDPVDVGASGDKLLGADGLLDFCDQQSEGAKVMFPDVTTCLQLDKIALDKTRMVASDDLGSSADFLVNYVVGYSLKRGLGVVLVSWSEPFAHYAAVAARCGVDLSGPLSRVELVFFDALCSLSCVKNHDEDVCVDMLQEIVKAVEEVKAKVNNGVVLVLDHASNLLDVGVQPKTLTKFLFSCFGFDCGLLVVLRSSNSLDGHKKVLGILSHAADIVISVSALNSGMSRDVSGELVVHYDLNPNNYAESGEKLLKQLNVTRERFLYRLESRQVKMSKPGLSFLRRTMERKSALFVCLGNICRSPIAESVFKDILEKKGVLNEWKIDSAATGPWHIGKRSDRRAIKVLSEAGLDDTHRARLLRKEDFEDFYYIFGMDDSNMDDIASECPKNFKGVMKLLGEYDPEAKRIVRDPYYFVPLVIAMGIKNLLEFLQPACTQDHIKSFAGRSVAVDMYCWIHKGITACAEDLILGRPTDMYVRYCVRYLTMLKNFGVDPIAVFDGRHLPSKAETEKKRRGDRNEARKRAADCLRAGNAADARKFALRAADVTSEMAQKVIDAVRGMKLRYVVAPYEADAQLAFLISAGLADVVLTEDSDLVVFGCERVFFKCDAAGMGLLYERSRLPACFKQRANNFTFEKFRRMCILSGCDYLESLRGIGIKKAFNIFSRSMASSDVWSQMKQVLTVVKISVPDLQDYTEKFQEAENTFLYQLVFDPETRKLRPLMDYPDGKCYVDFPYAGDWLDEKKALQTACGNYDLKTDHVVANIDTGTWWRFRGDVKPVVVERKSAPKPNVCLASRTIPVQESKQLTLKTFFARKRVSPAASAEEDELKRWLTRKPSLNSEGNDSGIEVWGKSEVEESGKAVKSKSPLAAFSALERISYNARFRRTDMQFQGEKVVSGYFSNSSEPSPKKVKLDPETPEQKSVAGISPRRNPFALASIQSPGNVSTKSAELSTATPNCDSPEVVPASPGVRNPFSTGRNSVSSFSTMRKSTDGDFEASGTQWTDKVKLAETVENLLTPSKSKSAPGGRIGALDFILGPSTSKATNKIASAELESSTRDVTFSRLPEVSGNSEKAPYSNEGESPSKFVPSGSPIVSFRRSGNEKIIAKSPVLSVRRRTLPVPKKEIKVQGRSLIEAFGFSRTDFLCVRLVSTAVMPPTEKDVYDNDKAKSILFSATKNELVQLNEGFKSFQRKWKNRWRLVSVTSEIKLSSIASFQDFLTAEALSHAAVFVIPGPQDKYTETEFSALKQYVENGGSLLITVCEGGEKKLKTNINFFLEEYGISVNSDAVVRTHFHKYHHPKECLIANGVVNRAVAQAAGKDMGPVIIHDDEFDNQCMSFVYPFGATLNVISPAIPILSTGSVSFPLNRPVCAIYQSKKPGGGKIAVVGSTAVFTDAYVEKEDNAKIRDLLITFLTSEEINFLNTDAEEPEISDYNQIPDTHKLAEKLRTCLQESDDIPTDFMRLFDNQNFSLDMKVLPKSLKAFETLGVKHEPLRLITPQFEMPLPPLQPAIFPPSFRELPNPPLELYDLDEAFSSEKARLAQITNKCSEEDLEYYVRECGDILGITAKLPLKSRDAKHILEYIFMQLVEFKKTNQNFDVIGGGYD